MAIPTLASITPTSGPPGGRFLVEITGTNFRTWEQPRVGPRGTPGINVRVLFGAESALGVSVQTSSSLQVIAPPYRGSGDTAALSAVDVRVDNLDDAGNLIPGETATSVSAFTYARPAFRPTVVAPSVQAVPLLIVRELVNTLRRQVTPNVVVATHPDYAEPAALLPALTTLPGLVVANLAIEEDPHRGRDYEFWTQPTGDATASSLMPPTQAFQIHHDVLGVSDNPAEVVALASAFLDATRRSPYLLVDTPQGRMQYSWDVVDPPALDLKPDPSGSSIATFRASMVVFGVDFGLAERVGVSYTAEQLALAAQQVAAGTLETALW